MTKEIPVDFYKGGMMDSDDMNEYFGFKVGDIIKVLDSHLDDCECQIVYLEEVDNPKDEGGVYLKVVDKGISTRKSVDSSWIKVGMVIDYGTLILAFSKLLRETPDFKVTFDPYDYDFDHSLL